jgi:hypothetical protein
MFSLVVQDENAGLEIALDPPSMAHIRARTHARLIGV